MLGKIAFPPQLCCCLGLAYVTKRGHQCRAEHLQGLVETGASKEHGQVVAAEVAFEGGSLHRNCGYLELGI